MQFRPLIAALFLALLFASPIAHADSNGVFLGVSAARLEAHFGPVTQALRDNSEAHRPAFDAAATSVALEFSVPLARRFSTDAVFVSGATTKRDDVVPVFFEPGGPTQPPTSTAIVTETEARALGVAGALRAHPAPNLTLFGKAGGLWVERTAVMTPRPPGNTFRQVVRERGIVPWVAVGARYVIFRGLTVTAEIGGGTDDVRTASIGIGWTL